MLGNKPCAAKGPFRPDYEAATLTRNDVEASAARGVLKLRGGKTSDA